MKDGVYTKLKTGKKGKKVLEQVFSDNPKLVKELKSIKKLEKHEIIKAIKKYNEFKRD